MKLFISGYKNISQNTLCSFLLNYYSINIYKKYYLNNTNSYPNNYKLSMHCNIPFKIIYFSDKNFCFINVYDPILYFHLLINNIKIKSYNIVNINNHLIKQNKVYNLNIKKFKQNKIYISNIDETFDYLKIYQIFNRYTQKSNKQYTIKFKIDYKTGKHTGQCTIDIYNLLFYNKVMADKNNLQEKYGFIITDKSK